MSQDAVRQKLPANPPPVGPRNDLVRCLHYPNAGNTFAGSDISQLVLFCDNGNKREEVRRFSPILRPGDYLVVHDWEKEIFPADIPPEFVSVWPDSVESSGLTKWFVRNQEAGVGVFVALFDAIIATHLSCRYLSGSLAIGDWG